MICVESVATAACSSFKLLGVVGMTSVALARSSVKLSGLSLHRWLRLSF